MRDFWPSDVARCMYTDELFVLLAVVENARIGRKMDGKIVIDRYENNTIAYVLHADETFWIDTRTLCPVQQEDDE